MIRVGELYEFRLLDEDAKRLGRRSTLLQLTTPVYGLAELGVREIRLCPKAYNDAPRQQSRSAQQHHHHHHHRGGISHQQSHRVSLNRANSGRSRSNTQGWLVDWLVGWLVARRWVRGACICACRMTELALRQVRSAWCGPSWLAELSVCQSRLSRLRPSKEVAA